MSKKVRMVLYVLSIVILAGTAGLCVLEGSGQSTDRTSHTQTDRAPHTKNQDTEKKQDTPQTADTPRENNPYTRISVENLINIDNFIPEEKSTTILFTGDVLFANAFKAGYDAGGIGSIIGDDLLKELTDADILMINNEFPFSDRGTPAPDKQFTFRCSPSYVDALKEMGVDIVTLANNHTLDYGKDALSDTFITLDSAEILYAGAGETIERAEEVQVIETNGKRFGFLGVSRVIPEGSWKIENSAPGLFSCYNDTRLIELVAEATKTCDFLAVYPHWGTEHEEYPQSYQTAIAQRCIAAGADLIVGSHPHCLQGVSYIDGRPVFYSLGNFIFGQTIDRSAVLKVTVDASGNASFCLLPVYATQGVTRLADGARGEEICRYLNRISSGAAISSDGAVTEK